MMTAVLLAANEQRQTVFGVIFLKKKSVFDIRNDVVRISVDHRNGNLVFCDDRNFVNGMLTP